MAQAVPDPLRRQIAVAQLTDAEMRRITRLAAAEADKIVKSAGDRIGSRVKSTQASLAKLSAQMWSSVGDAAKIGIGDAAYEAIDMTAMMDLDLMSSAGIPSQYWRQSMIAQAQEGANTLISRKENGITLSERVYKNSALTSGKIDDIIDKHLLLGHGAKEIARDVVGFINPSVPGGASYAAMRLGRSEVQNAFHRTSVRNYQESPWVETVKWNLSGSHPVPDECNQYAESVHFRGGEPGHYKPDDVPNKPHPQCLCYVTPVVMDVDDFVKAFKSGKYDSYMDQKGGCTRVA